MRAPDLRLVVITDAQLAAPRRVEDVVEQAVLAGAPAVQLRDKSATARELFEQAQRVLAIVRAAGALLFINDRLDVALAVGADGVHLGPDDMPITAARRVAPPLFLIGYSTDDPELARRAEQDGASYIGCGAVFGTTSKDVAGECIGMTRLGAVVRAVSLPVIGIGGVSADNVKQVAETGAAGSAVIGAIMTAADVRIATHALLLPFTA